MTSDDTSVALTKKNVLRNVKRFGVNLDMSSLPFMAKSSRASLRFNVAQNSLKLCILVLTRFWICAAPANGSTNGAVSSDLNTCTDFSGDEVDDSLFEPFQIDPDGTGDESLHPPKSTLEEEIVSAMELGDSGEYRQELQTAGASDTTSTKYVVDQHWGFDPEALSMRDALRNSESKRPPIFLVPGLAASRLVAWRHKECRQKPLMSDIRVQDYVWLNLNLIMQMGTIDERCFVECIKLGINQTDSDDPEGCKLRPDEGLDAISSLSVGGIQSQLIMGRTNTVYSWLIQWLSDNLGYDVGSIVGFPYDWRLSPDKLQDRDGLFTNMRRRIETAVETNGEPGILVAHSMGNLIFRYFLSWLQVEFETEVYIQLLESNGLLEQSVDSSNPLRDDCTCGRVNLFRKWIHSKDRR